MSTPRQSLLPPVSLKWMLLGLVVLGAGAGLLGKAFLEQHELFLVAGSVLSTIVPFVLAIATIIVLGRRTENRRVIAWAILLACVPPLGLTSMAIVEKLVQPGVGGMGLLSTEEIIANELPARFGEPWVWRELSQRLSAGTLSTEQADAVVAALASHMKAKRPAGWDSPLHWSDEFLKQADAAGYLTDETLVALHDAFYGPRPVVAPLDRLREGDDRVSFQVQYGSPWADNSGLPWRLLWTLTEATVDGQPVELDEQHRGVDSEYLREQFSHNFQVGENLLALKFECAYVDASKLFGLDTSGLPRDRWPTAKKSWTDKIEAPIRVYTAGDPLVKPTTDPQLNPRPVIRVERCVVQQDAEGYSLAVKLDFVGEPPVSVSADLVARVGGEEAELGRVYYATGENRSTSTGSEYSGKLAQLAPDVTHADLALLPNASYVEKYPEVKQVWGRPIVLRNIPLDRLDLREPAEGAEPP